MTTNLNDLYIVLGEIIDPETAKVMDSMQAGPGQKSHFISLPDGETANLSPPQVSRLVALTSNKYAEACRLASVARGKYKIAEARYKYKYRTSLKDGKNTAEREANAMGAAEEEYQEMVLCSVIVELCEAIESSNRIASESSRRMLLGADQAYKAEGRFADNADSLTPKDYQGF